jgi:hypothetical protein
MAKGRVIQRTEGPEGEVVVTEDDRKRLPNGEVQVEGHWVVRSRSGRRSWRRTHLRRN